MYDFSAKFRSIFRILSVYLMSLLMFSGNSYGMESNQTPNYNSIPNSNLNDNKSKISRDLSVAIFGENKEEINKIASLLDMNDSNKTLVNHQLNYQPNRLYESMNNKKLKFMVIPYKHGDLQKTIVDQFGEESFDYFDFIIHISNKDTLTADRIKYFYDTLNYAWLGKNYYPIYSPFGELRDVFWKKACAIRKDNTIPRTLFFIFNGTEYELYKLDSFDEVKNYISSMPDSRSIYTLKLDDVNVRFEEFIDAMNTISTQGMSKDISLKRIDELKKKLRKNSVVLGVVEQNWQEQQSPCLLIRPFKDCLKPRVSN